MSNRGGRGGSNNGKQTPQKQSSGSSTNSRGGGRGGGRGGFQSPNSGRNNAAASQLSDVFVSPKQQQQRTPQRSTSGGGGGGGGNNNSGYSNGKPRFTSPGNSFRSPAFHSPAHTSRAPLIPVGQFGIDERAFKDTVTLSLKLGTQDFGDEHIESVVIPWLRNDFESHLKREYVGYRHDQIQVMIELQDNMITSRGVTLLLAYLSSVVTSASRPYRLAALKLWNNQIENAACDAIAQYLTLLARCDVPLLELHLSHNQIGEVGAAKIMCAVYEYSRFDTKLTALTPGAAASSSTSAASLSNCVDTGVIISPPSYPLWLRLEWNCVNYILFASYFKWVNLEPAGLKRAAKQERRNQAKKLAAAASPSLTSSPNEADLKSPSRQSSDASTVADDDADDEATADDTEEAAGEEDDESKDDTIPTTAADDERKENEDDEELPSMESLSLEDVSSSSTSAAKKSSLTLPSSSLRICPASNRTLCSVRMCKYHLCAQIHLCFFHLQHQSYEDSDLLDGLQKFQKRKKKQGPTFTPLVRSESQTSSSSLSVPTKSPSSASTSPPAASPVDSSPLLSPSPAASSSSPSAARPLVLFLDTNTVFNMISARHEAKYFHWNRLLQLATSKQFGTCFEEEGRKVYLILCSAVLNEIDARKEYSKKSEQGRFGAERFNHLSTLARQIKDQFEMNVADPSKGFLARCKNVGGKLNGGFLKTISISQGEMNVHPLMRGSSSDNRNTSNDRRILNAALFWIQSVGETGIVALVTDDRNLQQLASCEGVPVVSLYSLDRALAKPQYAESVYDSITLRDAMASCSNETAAALASDNIQPAARMDKSVYDCLEEAVKLVTTLTSSPPTAVDTDEVAQQLESWRAVLANAPQLISTLRSRSTASASPTTPAK